MSKITELERKLAEAEAKLASMQKSSGRITVRIVEPGSLNKAGQVRKGSVCVYGLQRWPVSLHPAQWRAVLALADEIAAACDQYEERWDRDGNPV